VVGAFLRDLENQEDYDQRYVSPMKLTKTLIDKKITVTTAKSVPFT